VRLDEALSGKELPTQGAFHLIDGIAAFSKNAKRLVRKDILLTQMDMSLACKLLLIWTAVVNTNIWRSIKVSCEEPKDFGSREVFSKWKHISLRPRPRNESMVSSLPINRRTIYILGTCAHSK
jgi:hypothetical protein